MTRTLGTRTFAWLIWGGTTVAMCFLAVPVIAIFAELTPRELVEGATSSVAVDALRLTAQTSLISLGLTVLLGTPAAYLIATRGFALRSLMVTVIELPLVLPPAVAGIGLLAAFSSLGLLGGTLDALGVSVAFTQAAVVMAVAFVSGPFYVRTAVTAFEGVDPDLVGVARTLGAGPGRTFVRVVLPLAAGGLGTAAALAFARGIGEFGATLVFAGSFQGVTQTLSLAVYQQFDVDFDGALAIGAELVVVSVAILLLAKLIPRWRVVERLAP